MEDYQLRVIQEFEDLVQKRRKLRDFLMNEERDALELEEYDLMMEQLTAMSKYGIILIKRIARWRTPCKLQVVEVVSTTKV
jgi:hypothetical protein